MQWQQFEEICTEYLNKTYGVQGKVNFILMGNADSTISDIRVDINNTSKFYVEVKMEESQCGQFVLLPDFESKKFVFSPRNNSSETSTTKQIIEHMNAKYDDYINGGTLDMDQQVFYDWIIEHYKSLNAKYVITAHGNQFLIFPIRKFSDYFDIKATYRVKRSGSHSPSKKQQEKVINLLKETKANFSYKIINDDLIVNGDGLRRGTRLDIDENTYWLAEHPEGLRVRILSKTANSNVIFSISLKKFNQDPSDLTEFISDLN